MLCIVHTTVMNQTRRCLMELTNSVIDYRHMVYIDDIEIGLWKDYAWYHKCMVLRGRQPTLEGLEHVLKKQYLSRHLRISRKKLGKGSEQSGCTDVHEMLRQQQQQ